MFVYQNYQTCYKSDVHVHSNITRSQHSKRSTSKRVLTQKNIKFLKSLGLKLKKVIKKNKK